MTFAFGGVDLTPYVTVSKATRTVAPRRRMERTDVPGMAGELVRFSGLQAAEVTVTGYLTPHGVDRVAHVRRLLARMLYSDAPQALILPDEPWSYLMAVYEGGAELSRHAHRPKVELPFLCPDPVAYGKPRTASVGSAAVDVDAGGTWPASPVVSVTPPTGSYWQITNLATGDYVRVNAAFTGSQAVVIDMGAQRCTVNGADHAVDVGSDFFPIDGAQRLKASAGTASLSWVERWL